MFEARLEPPLGQTRALHGDRCELSAARGPTWWNSTPRGDRAGYQWLGGVLKVQFMLLNDG